MTVFTLTKRVNASPDRVFAVFTDLRAAPQRVPDILRMEVLTDGPVGEGTRFKETRKMFGKESTELMWIEDFRPGQGFTMCGDSCGAAFRTAFTLTPDAGGTRVDAGMEVKARTTFAKVMGWLMGPMMRGTMLKCVQKDLDALATVAESAA